MLNSLTSLTLTEAAIQSLEAALKIYREIGDRKGEGKALNSLGYAYYFLEEYQKAIELYQQSLTLACQNGDGDGELEVTALYSLGYVYKDLGEYQKAIELYQQYLTLARQNGDYELEDIPISNLGLALFQLSNFTEAEKYLFSSLDFFESMLLEPLVQELFILGSYGDREKVDFIESQRDSYKFLQKALIAQNKTDQALEVSERGRGRVLAELLAKRFTSNSEQASPGVSVAQLQQIARQQNSNSEQASPGVSLAQLQQIARQQNATIVEYSSVSDDFSVGDKQQAKESELYIWVIKPTGEVEFRRSDLKPLSQQQNIDLSRLIFAARCFDNDACRSDYTEASTGGTLTLNQTQNRSLYNTHARSEATKDTPIKPSSQPQEFQKLYQLLIKPIEEFLPTNPNERVIFIPTDSLFNLPFAALKDDQGKFLIEKHTILTSPSIALLETTHQRRQSLSSAATDIVIVGNPEMPKVAQSSGEEHQLAPLPNAETEAKEIAKLLNTSALIGADATESTVVQRMKNARIIHLATHGIFDESDALKSSLALTPGDYKDGFLTADEVFKLRLNAELVVLSGCDTGRGELTGEGVFGLSRSFLSAGVPSLVVSLWTVDDQSTAQLMTEFYKNFKEGKLDKAQALRQAMLTVKNQNPDPQYWAAFTLMGEAQ